MSCSITIASSEHASIIEKLAKTIWEEHYTPIIGVAQVEYMLDKFQSTQAIISQMADGYEYYIINYDNSEIGYLSVKQEDEALFLSKVYVSKNQRGKGIGKIAMNFVEELCMSYKLPKIRLTVNKFNLGSKKVYEQIGFEDKGSVVIDIGGGFIMDDFAMEKVISN